MTTETKLGKIKSMQLGYGGYQDAQLGFSFQLGGGDGWGICTQFYGAWADGPSSGAKWTKEDQTKALGEAFLTLRELMDDAGVKDARDLVGKPVEVEIGGDGIGTLQSWRILKEVL